MAGALPDFFAGMPVALAVGFRKGVQLLSPKVTTPRAPNARSSAHRSSLPPRRLSSPLRPSRFPLRLCEPSRSRSAAVPKIPRLPVRLARATRSPVRQGIASASTWVRAHASHANSPPARRGRPASCRPPLDAHARAFAQGSSQAGLIEASFLSSTLACDHPGGSAVPGVDFVDFGRSSYRLWPASPQGNTAGSCAGVPVAARRLPGSAGGAIFGPVPPGGGAGS